MLVPGFAHANADSVDITIHCRGSHGARPYLSIDPVVIAAETIISLQTIVSRRIPAGEKAVITVGAVNAGTKHNIIPSSAKLQLTVRSYSNATRTKLHQEIKRVAKHVALAHNAPQDPDVILGDQVPAVYNDPQWTERLRLLFTQNLGAEHVKEHEPSLGGEDFAWFPRRLKVPGVIVLMGGVERKKFEQAHNSATPLPGLHSPFWAPDPIPTVQTAMSTMSAAVMAGLN
jgi:hippurate hydrolase